MKKFFLAILFLLAGCAKPSAVTLAIVGDSLSSGYGLEENAEIYPKLLKAKLEDEHPTTEVTVINDSIPGSRSDSAAARMAKIMEHQPNVVLLELGANDGINNLSHNEMIRNLSQAIEIAQHGGAQVVLAGLHMPHHEDRGFSFYRALTAAAAHAEIALIPDILDGVAGDSSKNINDGMHPNEAGHQRMFETIYPYIEEALF